MAYLLSVKDVKILTGVSRQGAYQIFRAEDFKFVVIGGHRYTTKRWLYQWLQDQAKKK